MTTRRSKVWLTALVILGLATTFYLPSNRFVASDDPTRYHVTLTGAHPDRAAAKVEVEGEFYPGGHPALHHSRRTRPQSLRPFYPQRAGSRRGRGALHRHPLYAPATAPLQPFERLGAGGKSGWWTRGRAHPSP